MFGLCTIGIIGCVAASIISLVVAVVSVVVSTVMSVEQKNAQENAARRMEGLQKDANNKAEARARGQSEVNKAITLKNLRRTREEFASAASYERLITDKTSREALRKRQEAKVESRHEIQKTQKPSLRWQSTGYSKGNPIAH